MKKIKTQQEEPLSSLVDGLQIGTSCFYPIDELFTMALAWIYGEDSREDLIIKERLQSETQFALIAEFLDERYGFSYTHEPGFKEFKLTYGEGHELKLDQLALFDKMREWGFLSVAEDIAKTLQS